MHADDAHALAEQHFATLVAALEAGRSDALVRYLETASRFHTYSFRNQCLIAAQCPTATRVAGYQAWRRLGRWVRRGETGIVILAPITRRRTDVAADYDVTEDADRTRVHGFRSAYVFDGTDASGHYTSAAGLIPGNYFAKTTNSLGYVNKLYGGAVCLGCIVTQGTTIAVIAGGSVSSIDFALAAGARITGHVTSAGVGVSSVTVTFVDERGVAVTSATSDSSGTYVSRDGLTPGRYYLTTTNSKMFVNGLYANLPCLNCLAITGTPVIVQSGTTKGGVDLVLVSGGRLAGRVADAVTGAGIRAATVHVFDVNGVEVSTLLTDIAGTYLSVPLSVGSYFAQAVNSQGYVNQLYQGVVCPTCVATSGTPITVSRDAVTPGIDFSLALGARISGTITDAVTQAPLANVSAMVFDSAGQRITIGVTNTAGQYVSAAGLTVGTYYVTTSNEQGYGDQQYQGKSCLFDNCVPIGGTPVLVSATNTTAGVDFSLAALGRLSGKVTDAGSGAGIPNVIVQIFNAQGIPLSKHMTDAQGMFTTTGLPTGTYFARTTNSLGFVNGLYNTGPCVNCLVTSGTAISVISGSVTQNVDFALAKGGLLAGQVKKALDSVPLPGVAVQVFGSDGSLLSTAQTDGDGNFVINDGLPAGSYFARTANSLGYVDEIFDGVACAAACDGTSGTPIVVSVGSTTRGVIFNLSR